jgi:hypothetical protein
MIARNFILYLLQTPEQETIGPRYGREAVVCKTGKTLGGRASDLRVRIGASAPMFGRWALKSGLTWEANYESPLLILACAASRGTGSQR